MYIHQGYWPVVYFSCNVLIWLWYQGDTGLIKWNLESSLLFSLLEEFEKIRHQFFLNLWEKFTNDYQVLGISLFRGLCLLNQLHYSFFVSSNFLFLHGPFLVAWLFLGIFQFILVCPVCLYIIVQSLLWSFAFLMYQM